MRRATIVGGQVVEESELAAAARLRDNRVNELRGELGRKNRELKDCQDTITRLERQDAAAGEKIQSLENRVIAYEREIEILKVRRERDPKPPIRWEVAAAVASVISISGSFIFGAYDLGGKVSRLLSGIGVSQFDGNKIDGNIIDFEDNTQDPTVGFVDPITDWSQTGSGLYYHVDTAGQGPQPGPRDTVEFTLSKRVIGGETIAQTSSPRGRVDTYSRGLTEGLQLMNLGAKYTFKVVPRLTATVGGFRIRDVKPTDTIIYEVTLNKIIPEPKLPTTADMPSDAGQVLPTPPSPTPVQPFRIDAP